MKVLPKPGSYFARRTGLMVIKQEKKGATGVYIPYALLNCDVEFSSLARVYISKSDGTIQSGAIQNLKLVFPQWETADPFDLESIPISENSEAAEFRVDDCFQEEYTPEPTAENPDPQPTMQFVVGWINPLEGGGRGMPTPMPVDERKAWLAKNGAKLRALIGKTQPAKPATAATEKPAPKTASKPTTGGPPSRKAGSPAMSDTVKTSSESEVWTDYKEANPDGDDDALADTFWNAAEEVTGDGKIDDGLTPAQWGEVATKLEV